MENFTCLSDKDCVFGQCVQGDCFCVPAWYEASPDCSVSWKDIDRVWYGFMEAQNAIFVIWNFITLFLSCWVLINAIRYSNRENKKLSTAPNWILICVILSIITRQITTIGDPESVRGWIPDVYSTSLINVHRCFTLIAYMILILFWIEIQKSTKVAIQNVQKFRPVLFVYIAIVTLLIPLGVIITLLNASLGLTIYSVILVLLILSLIITSSVFGFMLLKKIKNAAFSGAALYRNYIAKTTRNLILVNSTLGASIIVLIVYTIVDTVLHSYRWAYFTLIVCKNFVETSVVFLVFLFVNRKSESRPSQATPETKVDSGVKVDSENSSGEKLDSINMESIRSYNNSN